MEQITPLHIEVEVRAIDSFLVGDRSVVKAVLTNADKTVTIGLTGAPGLPRAYSQLIAAAPDLLHAINGDHGDRLNFVASLLMEARNLPLPSGVDWDAWAVTLDEADLFVKEARAAIAKAQGGAK